MQRSDLPRRPASPREWLEAAVAGIRIACPMQCGGEMRPSPHQHNAFICDRCHYRRHVAPAGKRRGDGAGRH